MRFKSGVKQSDHLGDIKNAGYEIDQTLDYAPEAAWLRAKYGEPAEALHRISELEKIPDVENVEPQMLRRRAGK